MLMKPNLFCCFSFFRFSYNKHYILSFNYKRKLRRHLIRDYITGAVMSELLEIDGSVLEGGGQILRISISLSAILGIPVRIINIRAGRSKPGLAAQHLKGIELVGQLCQAKLKGAHIGSTEVEFIPGKIIGGHYMIDVKTAGHTPLVLQHKVATSSISLLLQVALPCALFADAPVTLDLKGGTNADMAPQIEYMTEVFRFMLQKFGGDFESIVHTRGYYPKGGGHMTVEVTPVKMLRGADISERGDLKSVHGWSFVAGVLPIKMAHQMADGFRQELSRVHKDVDIECYKETAECAPLGNCNGIVVVGEFAGCTVGADGLGKRGVEPVEVGRKAGEQLRETIESGACVDQHTQDQLIVYMALGEGRSVVRAGEVTLHTKTAIYIAETLTKTKFSITPNGAQNLIECTGIGFQNRFLV